MSDSTDKDQLSLWDKLNRLYGKPSELEAKGAAQKPENLQTEGVQGEKPNRFCVDCEQECKQWGEEFKLALCPLAKSGFLQKSASQVYPLRNSMGFDKINDTCKLCRRSCKQTTPKLNRMLCLGFEPLRLEDEKHQI